MTHRFNIQSITFVIIIDNSIATVILFHLGLIVIDFYLITIIIII